LSQTRGTGGYADQNLTKGLEAHSGREALLTLEQIIKSRKTPESSNNAPEKVSAAM
jgi:hypothetical protein